MQKMNDWKEIKERYKAWWNGTLRGGPILKTFVLSPGSRNGGTPAYEVQPEWYSEAQDQAVKYGMGPAPHYLGLGSEVEEETRKQYWLDLRGRLALFQSLLDRSDAYGDGFFHFFPDLGSAVAASFLGSEPRYGGRSMLNESVPAETLEEIEATLQFDPNNFWWQTALNFVRLALDTLQDRVLVGFPNLGGALDTLASVRGTQNLLMDLVMNPGLVKRLEMEVSRVWIRYYEALYAAIRESGQSVTTSWVGVLGEGKMFPVQCDIAVMISPDMFQEFAVPSLKVQAQALDHAMLHYHGEGPKKTLNHVLDIDEIQAIQWSPGVHDPMYDEESWLPTYKRITEAGKGLLLLEVRPDHVEWLVSKLPAERLAMNVLCESQEQARDLWSRYGRS
jgi:hypothetical protein